MSENGKVTPLQRDVSKMSLAEAREEVERLRDLLNARPHFEDKDWAIVVNVDEPFRDRWAANAWVQAKGHAYTALRILGYDTEINPETHRTSQNLSTQHLEKIAKKLFDKPAVRDAVANDLRKAEPYKDLIIDRLVEQAVYGSPENMLKAASMLAKMNVGWLAPTKMQVQSQSVNVTAFLSDPALRSRMLEHLGHEPGEAAAISSEARKALEAGTIET